LIFDPQLIIKIDFYLLNCFKIFNDMLIKVFRFYYEGFRGMTWGKKLWRIILLKLFIMFAILRIFFFPDLLKRDFKSDEERADYILEQITNP